MIASAYLGFIGKSRLLYALYIISEMLSGTTTLKCYSNQFHKTLWENCGPIGFCFILTKGSSVKDGNYTVRGCDHTFLCELISETEGVKKVAHTRGVMSYCMDDVQYKTFSGYFCCCKDDDWCNKRSRTERAPMKHDLENLIQGTPTKDKWFKLQEIAEKYEILAE